MLGRLSQGLYGTPRIATARIDAFSMIMVGIGIDVPRDSIHDVVTSSSSSRGTTDMIAVFLLNLGIIFVVIVQARTVFRRRHSSSSGPAAPKGTSRSSRISTSRWRRRRTGAS